MRPNLVPDCILNQVVFRCGQFIHGAYMLLSYLFFYRKKILDYSPLRLLLLQGCLVVCSAEENIYLFFNLIC
jgi:hypothetical protein